MPGNDNAPMWRSAAVRSRALRGVSALAAATLFVAAGARAEQVVEQGPPSARDSAPGRETTGTDEFEIIVFGSRPQTSILQGLETDRVYDADRIASYAANSIEELLEALARENGDEAPAILVNGRPITNRTDISGYPPEAIEQIETLPRGAAARVGGAGGQRVYNIVLKSSVRTLTLTGGRQWATDGGIGLWRAEAQATLVRGLDRVNLSVRGNGNDELLESDRDLVPFVEPVPFAATGNVIGATGGEIDPALSLLAGRTVLQAMIDRTRPALGDFARTAGMVAGSDQQRFRTLRARSRSVDASLAANKQVAQGTSASLNARIGALRDRGKFGLPTGSFLVPASNAFTPFSTPVLVAYNDPSRPLLNATKVTDYAVTAGMVADMRKWQLTATATYSRTDRATDYDQASALGFLTVPDGANPFDASLAATIPVETIAIRNPSTRREVTFDMAGPIVALPAGSLRGRIGATLGDETLTPRTPFAGGTTAPFRRPANAARASLIVPLTRSDVFLGRVGDSDLTLELSRTELGRYGRLDYASATLNWQPFDWLRLSGLRRHAERSPEPDQIFGAVTVTQNLRFFDPVRNETVSVTGIGGGFPGLRNEAVDTTRLSADASVLKGRDLHLTAEYLDTGYSDQIGYTPPPTAAVVAAFPDRFVRDASGRLVSVDMRPVNFDRQTTRQLRLGATGSFPLHDEGGEAKPVLQFSLGHTLVLSNTLLIREGLPVIDLLDGGASGVGTARQRNTTEASLALTDRGSGVRMNVSRRGESLLLLGPPSAQSLLTFGAVTRIDLRAFADLERFFPAMPLAKGARLTLTVDNLANDRQPVTDTFGATPYSSQAAFRDPIGRLVGVELRKAF